jgi:hypothetical protein
MRTASQQQAALRARAAPLLAAAARAPRPLSAPSPCPPPSRRGTGPPPPNVLAAAATVAVPAPQRTDDIKEKQRAFFRTVREAAVRVMLFCVPCGASTTTKPSHTLDFEASGGACFLLATVKKTPRTSSGRLCPVTRHVQLVRVVYKQAAINSHRHHTQPKRSHAHAPAPKRYPVPTGVRL